MAEKQSIEQDANWTDAGVDIEAVIAAIPDEDKAKEAISLWFSRGYTETALSIAEKFHIPEDVLQDLGEQVIIDLLSEGGRMQDIGSIRRELHMPEDIWELPAVIEAAKKGIIALLHSGRIERATEFRDEVSVPESFFTSEKYYAAGKEALIHNLLAGYTGSAIFGAEHLGLPEDVLKSPEVVHQVIREARIKLEKGHLDVCLDIIDKFKLSSSAIEEIDDEASQGIAINDLLGFITILPKENINSLFPKTMERIKELMVGAVLHSEDLADYLVENFDHYHKIEETWLESAMLNAVQHYSVAKKFIVAMDDGSHSGWSHYAISHKIYSVSKVIVKNYGPAGFSDEWKAADSDYLHDGYEDQGFLAEDPYKEDPNLFKKEQIRLAYAIADAMNGKIEERELEGYFGENSQEAISLLKDVQLKIYDAHAKFLERIRTNSGISDEDESLLLDREYRAKVGMTNLSENVVSFVARFLAQDLIFNSSVIDMDSVKQGILKNLEKMLDEGYEKYLQVLEVDVPLYDKLYEEFDELRKDKRKPLEVYLGRDGIYAYVGRRAQDVARRRKMGWFGRKEAKAAGEVLEINPKYLVYPRYFRDNLDRQTKQEFLQQESISPETDPIFYDTGYTGTIPEQIMEIMGFKNEDIEKRIRLLSAPSAHRRVKGIAENARSAVIEYIEHNSKTEETAMGLMKDEKTGKIRPVAKPTSPEEQFYFAMIKQAIVRHYWLKEKLHHKE